MSIEQPTPSELQGYDVNNPNKPYITGVFGADEYQEMFVIGDGKNYSYVQSRSRRFVRSLDKYSMIVNEPLQEDITYSMFVRAHENQVWGVFINILNGTLEKY